MAEKNVTYCLWEGQPAILVRLPDGRVHGHYRTGAGEWRKGFDLEIFDKGTVTTEEALRGMFPGLKFPDLN